MKPIAASYVGPFRTSTGNEGLIYRCTVVVDDAANYGAIDVYPTSLSSPISSIIELPAARYIDDYNVRTKLLANAELLVNNQVPINTNTIIPIGDYGLNFALEVIDVDGDPIKGIRPLEGTNVNSDINAAIYHVESELHYRYPRNTTEISEG